MEITIKVLNTEAPYRRFTKILNGVENGTFRAISIDICPVCGENHLEVDGYFSDGSLLASGYTPKLGELVRNKYMVCDNCGFEQAS